MKNMFIEHVTNRTLSTKSETPKSMIVPNSTPNFGLYNLKMNPFSDAPNERNEEHVNLESEKNDLPSSQTKTTVNDTKRVDNQSQSIEDNKPNNDIQDNVEIVSEKKPSNLKKDVSNKEKQQEAKIIPNKSPNQSISPSKIKNNQEKFLKKEISAVTKIEKPDSTSIDKEHPIEQSDISLTSDESRDTSVIENNFITNLHTQENKILKNTIQINENKKSNAKPKIVKITKSNKNTNPDIPKTIEIEDSSIDEAKLYKDQTTDVPNSLLIEPSKKSPPIKTSFERKTNQDDTIVTINIDKIEVRTNMPKETKNYRSTSKSNRISLREYLELRKKGEL